MTARTTKRLGLVLFAVAGAAGGPGAAPPAEADTTVRHLQPVSEKNPFTSGCGLKVDPPFNQADFRPTDTATEPHMAANPRNPKNIVAAWIQDFSTTHVVAATRDGGATWTRVIAPRIGECNGGAYEAPYDPYLSYAPDGTLYMAAMAGGTEPPATGPTNAIIVSRSDDGGFTWQEPTVAEPSMAYNDRPAVQADPRDKKRVIVGWALRDGPFGANTVGLRLSTSPDRGATWSPITDVYTPSPFTLITGSAMTALADGSIVWTWGELDVAVGFFARAAPRLMRSMRSTDGGRTWSAPVTIGEQSREREPVNPDTEQSTPSDNAPSIGALPGGGLVAGWSDIDDEGRGRIFVARSRDGATWSKPEVVIHAPAAVSLGTAAVDGAGRVGLLWIDMRTDRRGDDPWTADVRGAIIDTDGKMDQFIIDGPWDLTTAWDDPRYPPTQQRPLFLGDYQGLAGLREGFAAAFPQAQPKAKVGLSQIFTAVFGPARRLSVRASVMPQAGEGGELRLRVIAKVRSTGGGFTRPAMGALVRADRARAVADAAGRAVLTVKRPRAGRLTVRASLDGETPARTRVRLRRAR